MKNLEKLVISWNHNDFHSPRLAKSKVPYSKKRSPKLM